MTPALIGLAGALLGAVTALVGAALTDRRAVRGEERRWRRDQLADAYEQTLRHLLRAANLRSEFTGGRGGAVLRRSHQRDWFNDLVEAQVSIRTAVRYCDGDTARALSHAADTLDGYVSQLVSGQRFDEKGFSIWAVLNDCIKTVTDAARLPAATRRTARGVAAPRTADTDPAREFPFRSGPPPAPGPAPGAPSGQSQIPMGSGRSQIPMGSGRSQIPMGSGTEPAPGRPVPPAAPQTGYATEPAPGGAAPPAAPRTPMGYGNIGMVDDPAPGATPVPEDPTVPGSRDVGG